MSRRRTIHVYEVLKMVNTMLAETTCCPDKRLGMASVLENILHQTDNYAGYGHLASAGVKNPGEREVSFEDESRRAYYQHRKLPKPQES